MKPRLVLSPVAVLLLASPRLPAQGCNHKCPVEQRDEQGCCPAAAPAQRAKPRPAPARSGSSAPSSAPAATPATLLLLADEDCGVSVDGGKSLVLKAGQPRAVAVALGQHLLQVRLADGESYDAAAETAAAGQTVHKLAVKAWRDARAEKAAPAPSASEPASPPPPASAAVAQPYIFTTLAGVADVKGDQDGIGSAARFYGPTGVATDSGGNIYATDTGNHTIRKIMPAGAVTTVAGVAGSQGSADGTGGAARFNYPASVATDSGGNLYVADTGNHTLRKGAP